MASINITTRTYKDLDLNFGRHPVTNDVNRRTGNAAIIGALKNLIQTNAFEKPFQPLFGSNLRKLLFEDISIVTADSIRLDILNCITNYEPRVGIDALRVQANSEENGYDVTLRFFINNLEAPVTLTMFLEKVR
jgi:phage baseplate assembly protein W